MVLTVPIFCPLSVGHQRNYRRHQHQDPVVAPKLIVLSIAMRSERSTSVCLSAT